MGGNRLGLWLGLGPGLRVRVRTHSQAWVETVALRWPARRHVLLDECPKARAAKTDAGLRQRAEEATERGVVDKSGVDDGSRNDRLMAE